MLHGSMEFVLLVWLNKHVIFPEGLETELLEYCLKKFLYKCDDSRHQISAFFVCCQGESFL